MRNAGGGAAENKKAAQCGRPDFVSEKLQRDYPFDRLRAGARADEATGKGVRDELGTITVMVLRG